MMNALFDRLTYDTNGYFAHYSQMLRSPQNVPHFKYISNKVYKLYVLSRNLLLSGSDGENWYLQRFI